MKQHVYRIGDQVEIVNPRWIKRVGYPLHWQDLMDEVGADQRTTDALKALGWTGKHMPRYFMQAVAKLHVEQRQFGGNERQIIYCPVSKPGDSIMDVLSSQSMPSHGYVGRVALVDGKRMAHTGTRYPSRSGVSHGYCGDEYWEEPGGLENRKTHIILRTTYGEIEACDVRLVKAVSAKS